MATLGNLAVHGNKLAVLPLRVDFLQLSLKLLNLGGVKL